MSLNRIAPRNPRWATPLALLAVLAMMLLLAPAMATAADEEASADKAEHAAAAKVDDAYRAAIKRYLTAQGGVAQIGESIAYGAANETLTAIQNSGTEVTEAMQSIVLEEALDSYGKRFGDIDTLTRIWAPVYARHFTKAEIDEMTEFFHTPVGKKSIALLPTINQEGMAALQQESFALTPEFQLAVDARFREAGIVGATPKN